MASSKTVAGKGTVKRSGADKGAGKHTGKRTGEGATKGAVNGSVKAAGNASARPAGAPRSGAKAGSKAVRRCWWCGDDPLYQAYHDHEWGVPVRDDPTLFEFLILEGMQAGLSWITILRKREAFRRAFAGFDVDKVARFSSKKVESLLGNADIIRNRLKIESAIGNARAFKRVQREFGTFSDYIWGFVDHEPLQNRFRDKTEVPASTPVAQALSADLKRRGFKFVGPTIVYAHMQATGMVNDHTTDCFRHKALRPAGPARRRA